MSAILSLPPFASADAERSVLGCMMQSTTALDLALERLTPEVFHRPDHARIFEVLRDLRGRGAPVDLVTVSDRVMALELSERVGGLGYVMALPDHAPSTENVGHYAGILLEGSARRMAHKILMGAVEAITRGGVDLEKVTLGVASEIGSVTANVSSDLVWLADLTPGVLEQAENYGREGHDVGGAINPIEGWREKLPFFKPGEIHVIAGRPGMGKSSLARRIVEANAGEGYGVGVFTLEMSPHDITAAMVSAYSQVSRQDIVRNRLEQQDWERLEIAGNDIGAWPVVMCRRQDLSIDEIVARAHQMRREMLRRGLKMRCLVIDYLQIIRRDSGGRYMNTSEIIGNQSRALMMLGKALEVPVILLAQLNREIEGRYGAADFEPMLSDMSESGKIEQDAGSITVVDRPFERGNPEADPAGADLYVIKNRFGPRGLCRAVFIGEFSAFDSFPTVQIPERTR